MLAVTSVDFKMTPQSKLNWSLTDEQVELIRTKQNPQQLYFALLLKYYEHEHSFFEKNSEIPQRAIKVISKQLDCSSKILNQSTPNRTIERYRSEIRDYFHSRAISQEDAALIKNWLFDTVFPQEALNLEQLKERVSAFLITKKIEQPSNAVFEQTIKSARHQYETYLFETIFSNLSIDTKASLDELLLVEKNNVSKLSVFKRWPGGLSLKTILGEADKLRFLRS
ncbi:MAG: DUF4158 domain-containing protein, partial [Gammaproteobacteria bacterium]|nr:DUF4158 domain-containing protein [Gammaproteobacteria bacterium]